MTEDSKKTDSKGRQVVVSVRFPAVLLERIHAVAAVEGVTANTVIRDGMDAYLSDRVASAEFQEASNAYLARAQAHVATARGERPGGSERLHA
ncbi:hypothetical protein ABZ490_29525 [Streptomyces sp. NPDC005811]|uniref:hypothetical protein n=1 Tax=Streptomyces sp. NPDC005811 TaxID=3154565 RepID=UPI0033F1B2BC